MSKEVPVMLVIERVPELSETRNLKETGKNLQGLTQIYFKKLQKNSYNSLKMQKVMNSLE